MQYGGDKCDCCGKKNKEMQMEEVCSNVPDVTKYSTVPRNAKGSLGTCMDIRITAGRMARSRLEILFD